MSLALALQCLVLGAATPTVAVLPFDNATGDAAYEPLRRGLADMVLTDLAGAPSLRVVERARLEELLQELSLQQTKAFDAATRAKTGKLLGATHVVFGTLTAVAPKVRLDVRVAALPKGDVVTKATAVGAADDLFDLEAQVVAALLKGLRVPEAATTSGHVSVQALGAYGRALGQVDEGRLDDARSTLAGVVRDAPDFSPAKVRYAEVLRALREAQKKRGSALDDAGQELTRRLTPLLGKAPVERSLGARIALANLALLELSRLLDAKKDEARWLQPSKRAQALALEERFLGHATALLAELRALRGKPRPSPALSEEDEAFSEANFGLDLSQWDFLSPTSLCIEVGAFVGSGWTPYRSDVPQFAVRPSRAQRNAEGAKAALGWFDVAQQELPLDFAAEERADVAGHLANERAEALVLLGRREEAVAQWQGFLDAYPRAEDFPLYSKKLEQVMLLTDEAEAAEAQAKRCDVAVLDGLPAHATRVWRAGGRKGLFALGEQLLRCGAKSERFTRPAWTAVAVELQRTADCDGFREWAARAAKAGVTVERGPQPCDAP